MRQVVLLVACICRLYFVIAVSFTGSQRFGSLSYFYAFLNYYENSFLVLASAIPAP
jgi:hypothetical protein